MGIDNGGSVGPGLGPFLPPSPALNNLFNDTSDMQDESVVGESMKFSF